jgi:hypothetical protein
MAIQFNTRNIPKLNVDNEAYGFGCYCGTGEFLRRRVKLGAISKSGGHALQRLAHSRIVVDDCNNVSRCRHSTSFGVVQSAGPIGFKHGPDRWSGTAAATSVRP